jgi:hypothetical protein
VGPTGQGTHVGPPVRQSPFGRLPARTQLRRRMGAHAGVPPPPPKAPSCRISQPESSTPTRSTPESAQCAAPSAGTPRHPLPRSRPTAPRPCLGQASGAPPLPCLGQDGGAPPLPCLPSDRRCPAPSLPCVGPAAPRTYIVSGRQRPCLREDGGRVAGCRRRKDDRGGRRQESGRSPAAEVR